VLNRVVLVGRLARDPEMNTTNSGKQYCTITIAVQRNYRNEEGQYDADFIPASIWGKMAQTCFQYLAKGNMIAIEGRLSQSSWTQNGQRRSRISVMADSVRFLDKVTKKESEVQQTEESLEDDLDDVPF